MIKKHPAKYSDVLLPYFAEVLNENMTILDPFAGTGKLRTIFPNCTLLEIEPEWAEISGAIVGDATNMPFSDNTFDAICTSPTYGNRMADSFVDHQREKKYTRNTYRHALGRKLSENNTGAMQWGEKYKTMHQAAWRECKRVLKNEGLLLLNISDHIRKGQIVPVTDWHISTLIALGFHQIDHKKIETKRNRYGANRQVRAPHESIVVFRIEKEQTE